jgi:hypothetical protein
MEIMLIVSLLIGFALLAARFGYDSRDRFSSTEERQARHGLVW